MLRPALRAGFVAFVVGVLVQWWSLRTGLNFAFWDAQAHLDIARRLVDSVTPGLQMLGTVWLPVPHLLMFPFAIVDTLWWSGVAGGIVGLAAYVTTVTSIHLLLVHRTNERLAWIGTTFVLLNPSLLYLQTTAMTEPMLLAFLVASAAAIDRWNDTDSRRALVIAGVCAALAVGSRYDGWFFALLATPTVAWLSWRRKGRWFRDAARFAAPCAAMGAAWLGYNWAFFGDALEFQRGVWSAQAQQSAMVVLPTRGDLLLSVTTYCGAAALSAGAVLFVLGLLAIPSLLRRLPQSAAVLLLLSVLPFNIVTLFGGQSAIEIPWGAHPGILNLRYGLMVLPGMAAAVTLVAVGLSERGAKWRLGTQLAALAAVIAQLALFGTHWPANVGALREGLAIRDGDRRQQAASDWLAGHYDGGRILVDEAVNVSPRTRIALRDRVYSWTWQLGSNALAEPENAVDWVLVDRHHANGKVLGAINGREVFRNRFDRAFAQDGLEIWRRR